MPDQSPPALPDIGNEIDDSIPVDAGGGFDDTAGGSPAPPILANAANANAGAGAPPAPTAQNVVDAMRSFIGCGEHPARSNCNDITKWYGAGCVKWCAETVSKACFDAGFRDSNGNWAMPGITPTTNRGFAWVAALRAAFQTARRFDNNPRAGDIFIVGNAEHTGLVEFVGPDGVIHTIEGNFGDDCVRNKRTTSITGYCHPPYSEGGIFTMLTDAEQAELLQKTRELHLYFLAPIGDVHGGVPWGVNETLNDVRQIQADIAAIKAKTGA